MPGLELSKCAIEYEPALNVKGKYFDDPKKYDWSVFQESGIKCPCHKLSKTIHRNKNNFIYQHCSTQKHLNYLKKLNENKIEENVIDKKVIEKEFKNLKTEVGRHHQNYIIQKSKNELLESQLTEYLTQIKELKIQVRQNDDFIKEQEKKITTLEKQLEKFQNIGKQFIVLFGYKLEE